MKQKFMFGLQVFITLILFIAIFVTYLERSDIKQSQHPRKNEIIDSEVSPRQHLATLYHR